MLDHINLPVKDIARSADFYQSALTCIKLKILISEPEVVGFGIDTWVFGLVKEAAIFQPIHVAFAASSQQQVQEFYAAAIRSGGIANGAPGLRPEYGAGYYSAYVLDPDGHNLEMVCRSPHRPALETST